ncbi:MAG: hypothetical protein ACLUD2_18555 [Clostridium sp.]
MLLPKTKEHDRGYLRSLEDFRSGTVYPSFKWSGGTGPVPHRGIGLFFHEIRYFNMDQTEIIENRDGKLAEDIKDNIGGSLDGYGIAVLAVETKSLDMPDDNKQSIITTA